MFERHGLSASRRLFVWFIATTIIPAVALGWLRWRMADQDRALQSQRRQQARDQAVELAATALQRTLAELDARLATASGTSPLAPDPVQNGSTLVVFGPTGVIARAGTPLPYYPAVAPASNANRDLFTAAAAVVLVVGQVVDVGEQVDAEAGGRSAGG